MKSLILRIRGNARLHWAPTIQGPRIPLYSLKGPMVTSVVNG